MKYGQTFHSKKGMGRIFQVGNSIQKAKGGEFWHLLGMWKRTLYWSGGSWKIVGVRRVGKMKLPCRGLFRPG